MKKAILFSLALLTCQTLAAQQAATVTWDSIKFLVGKWVGEGSAETGQPGSGFCSFESGLQNKVLIRRNHAEYPATKEHAAIVHDDLMIIYPDAARHGLRGFYTDNEGNVIHYTVTTASNSTSAVFLGDTEPGARRYRLTYTLTQPEHMTIDFEMAPPDKPDQFQKFISGKLRRSAEAK